MKVNIGKYTDRGRKIDVKIEGSDVWSFDHTLAYIVLPNLLLLKEVKHGVPSEFVEVGGADYESQGSFDFYKETHNESWNLGSKKWDEVLDKMIWSFYQLAFVDYNSLYHHGIGEYELIELEKLSANPLSGKMEKLYEMVDKNKNDHWFDTVGLMCHEERIQEGIELFAKYYRNLWD